MVPDTSKKCIMAYYPGADFPSASVTGGRCDLMCEHCRAVHLKGMVPVEDDGSFLDLAQSVLERNGTGILLSGGCDGEGTVPVIRRISAVRTVSPDLEINVHAGFVTAEEAAELAEAGVSCFSVDIHQDEGEIRSVLHLQKSADDYSHLLDILLATGVKVMPHLTAGFGRDDLWMSAKLVLSKGIKDVVLLSMMPTEGTAVEESVLSEDAVVYAVRMLQDMGLNVILGCMRDRSLRNLERMCIEAGVNRIANPSIETLKWAEQNGYEVVKRRICCCYD